MTPVKVFTCKIKDPYGGEYPQAVVAILDYAGNPVIRGKAKDAESGYEVTNTIEYVSYKVQYWYSAQTKAQGFRSQPLLIEGGDGFTDMLDVDIEREDIANVLEGNLQVEDKILHSAKLDLISRFA